MTINYAEKYSAKVDERFTLASRTDGAVNNDYDFIGVKTVNVYSIPTAPMNDYTREGANRYGEPEELENSVQEMTLTQDRSFTFTIDRGNYDETMMTEAAGAALNRQITEVITPEIDKYRLSVMAANAGNTGSGAITKGNAYSAMLAGGIALDNGLVPSAGRVAYVTASYYALLKEDNNFIKSGDLSQEILIRGQVGEVDGVAIIKVPDSYLPTNVPFIITQRIATVAPRKLVDYKIHDNPPGINGWLVEGRVIYDAFVLNNKAVAIYAHITPIGTLTVTSEAGTASGDTKITVTESAGAGNSFVYKVGTAAETVVFGQNLSTWTALTSGSDITAATGKKITVAEVDANGKAVKAGNATVTAHA